VIAVWGAQLGNRILAGIAVVSFAALAFLIIRAAINAEHVAAYRKQAANARVSSPILVGLRPPILVSFLRTTVGSGAGEASAQVIDALAKAFGAQPIPEAVKAAIEADPNAAANVDPVDASDNQSQ
jgi:hypothetical protein